MKFKEKDILLLMDGRILQYINKMDHMDMAMVVFIDSGEHSWLDLKEAKIDKNLGQTDSVLFQFYATNSLHVRLNRLGRV